MRVGGQSSGGGGTSNTLRGADLVRAVLDDPAATRALADALGAQLAPTLAQTAARVARGHQTGQAGQRLAATVITGSGAIQGASGGKPAVALVTLGGAATPVPAVVPAHVLPDLAAGAEVWVEPVNGNAHDLLVTAIRAYTGTPVASQALAALPKVVASIAEYFVTTAGQNITICAYTPSSAGVYRFSAALWNYNSTPGAAKPNVWASYTDAVSNGAEQAFFTGIGNGAPTPVVLAGAALANGYYALNSLTAYCAANHALSIAFEDSVATPQSHVAAIIEHLA